MTMEMSEGFYRALRYAKRCGVHVEMVTRIPWNAPHQAPTVRAYIRAPGQVQWQAPQKMSMDDEAACALIHETHHALLWRLTNVSPQRHDETGGMLALDHRAMQGLRLKWSVWMSTFWFGGHDNWMAASTAERSKALIEAYDEAINEGWLERDGRPAFFVRSS